MSPVHQQHSRSSTSFDLPSFHRHFTVLGFPETATCGHITEKKNLKSAALVTEEGQKAHGGNCSSNVLLQCVHPKLHTNCKKGIQSVHLRKVLVLNLSGSWSPPGRRRSHVAALEQFRPGHTPYRIAVCWKPIQRTAVLIRPLLQSLKSHLRRIQRSTFSTWAWHSLTFVTITRCDTDEAVTYIQPPALQTFITVEQKRMEKVTWDLQCWAWFVAFAHMLIHRIQKRAEQSGEVGSGAGWHNASGSYSGLDLLTWIL